MGRSLAASVLRFESVREFSKALQDAVEQSEEPELHRSSLQEGQCAECGSVNDMARQFCRGCGASLDETCPECGAGEKVWERFCGKCGTDIPAVLEAQIESARELPGRSAESAV